MAYTNSSLVTYKRITYNKTSPRKHTIDTITIHCYVGQVTAKQGCDYFATTNRQVSSNYVVGKDGSIGLSVEEKDRAWTSSNASNDHRAVTIEVACDTTHPYAITDAAMKSLINLVADICKRNNIKQLKWKGDKSLIGNVSKQNMTVHRWFASTACPGDYLYNKHSYIAEQVNKKLGTSVSNPTSSSTSVSTSVSTNKIDTVKEVQKWANTNYKSGLVVDGVYGKNTKKALVKILQTELNQTYKSKLVIDGIWGNKTKAACPTLKKDSKNDIVGVLQALLICNGYKDVYLDNHYGSITTTAVKSYQRKVGLSVDGIAGKNTFAKLCI